MRKFVTIAGALAAMLAFAAVALTAAAPQARTNKTELFKSERHFLAKAKKAQRVAARSRGSTRVARAAPGTAQARNMEVVAHNALGGRGFNADVWEHDGYAYVGQWGFSDWAAGSKQRFCPSGAKSGVAVVEVAATDPANVTHRVSTLQNPARTSAEDVVAYTASAPQTPAASQGRDIAAAGIQVCGGSRLNAGIPRGLMLWDVTDAANPVQLSFVDTGCCTRGVHEFEIEHHANGRTYAYATVPASEYAEEGSPSGFRDRQGRGDFRMIDITDPSNPFEASDWGVIHDAGGPLGPGQGCDPDAVFGHGAEPSHDGTVAYLSYWDSGFVALDVSNPANPTYLRDSDYEPNEDGDAHSAMYDDDRGLLFSADEDFCKVSGPGIERGYGYLRVWDYWSGAKPRQLSTFRTPNSMWPTTRNAGDYTVHNPWHMGTDVYMSWYSDGIRVADASNPDPNPATSEEILPELAYFVPPRALNPVHPSQRGVLSNEPQVWGVVVRETTDANGGRCATGETTSCLIYASDMNSGLWVLRRTD
jgi:hypothetical protein